LPAARRVGFGGLGAHRAQALAAGCSIALSVPPHDQVSETVLAAGKQPDFGSVFGVFSRHFWLLCNIYEDFDKNP